ncbi:putative Peroxyureidoacrylate/ureidoacrylate amidohydrolase RutB [Saccharata proteae CBS 121410]|uniref:Peroxyureidoacrylate/ureidoacrylate amidohydrolase RutB n=1 Tax=Saccharata proteae CBS 121410 TaxID=1314787 RepID=A0A9P4HUG8_9PEZI|nr:putative Peroxyureidoacrylate/ureidoacrylate amidohydrolase RutB [Saccharata proteae CBS 121410]
MASLSKSNQIATTKPYPWPYDASFSKETTALVIIDMQLDFCSKGGYITQQGYDVSHTRAIIPALQIVLHNFRDAGWQVYHTREGHRPDLSTLSPRELYRSRNNTTNIGIGSPSPLGGRFLIRGSPGWDIIPELAPFPFSPTGLDPSGDINTVNYPLATPEPVIDKPSKSAFCFTDFALILRNRGIKNLVIGGVTTDVCVSSTAREATELGFDVLILADACAAVSKEAHDAVLETVSSEGGVFGAVGSWKDVITAIGMQVKAS